MLHPLTPATIPLKIWTQTALIGMISKCGNYLYVMNAKEVLFLLMLFLQAAYIFVMVGTIHWEIGSCTLKSIIVNVRVYFLRLDNSQMT